jgi:hypothetical protein
MQIRRTYTQMEALDLLHNSEHSSNGIRVCLEGKLVCTGDDSVKEESLSEHQMGWRETIYLEMSHDHSSDDTSVVFEGAHLCVRDHSVRDELMGESVLTLVTFDWERVKTCVRNHFKPKFHSESDARIYLSRRTNLQYIHDDL